MHRNNLEIQTRSAEFIMLKRDVMSVIRATIGWMDKQIAKSMGATKHSPSITVVKKHARFNLCQNITMKMYKMILHFNNKSECYKNYTTTTFFCLTNQDEGKEIQTDIQFF